MLVCLHVGYDATAAAYPTIGGSSVSVGGCGCECPPRLETGSVLRGIN